ncbi:acid protease [Aureobasidium sp. EXF-10728]|nr:acid protease [Aureobasidium sp. EXF-10728]
MRLLQATALAAFSVPVAARGDFDFRINQPRRLVAVQKPSPDKVTAHSITLGRANTKVNSLSAGYLQAIRSGKHVDGVYSRLRNGTADLVSVNAGSVFLAPLTAGAETFEVVIDTGSSDTWLVNSQFTCVDPTNSAVQNEADCMFGPAYSLTSTAEQISNRNFNISYADGERLNGEMITEDLTFAGITVENQTMGLVTYAGWYGDGASSGLVGLAYASLTNQYSGNNPSADIAGMTIPYNPLLTSMFAQNLTAPLFSIALDRDVSRSAQSAGGVLAVGGIPDIPHGTFWASANISVLGIDASTGQPEYQFYSIVVDGWAVSKNWNADFDVKMTGSTRKTPLLGAPTRNVIVDSGTSLIYVPTAVASALAAAFNPPATVNPSYGLYTVACNATVPLFGVTISSKVFYINPLDLIIDTGLGFCVMGVQDNNGGLTIIGDVFMRNVLTVFDVGAAQVRFSARTCQLTDGTITTGGKANFS